ncbi:MAG: type II secretion system F family protein [Candidatus Omnitrophota bacterium]
MPKYAYKACDKSGKQIEGIVESVSREDAAGALKANGYLPIDIRPVSRAFKMPALATLFKRVRFSDINMFTRQFYTLQKAGLPVISSLEALYEQAVNPFFKETIRDIKKDIEGGKSLSEAFAGHPRVFGEIYVNMLKCGEISGTLEDSLEKLAKLGEKEEQTRMRIKTATRYPLIVVVAIVSAFLILITVVVPRFTVIYGQFTASLPLPTRMLLLIHKLITQYWWLLIVSGGAAYFIFRRAIGTPAGRYLWDSFKLKLPVFGQMTLKSSMSKFALITGTLMRSGVPILNVLDLTAQGVGNKVIAVTINSIKESVNEGKGMALPMKNSGMFPPVVIQMVSVGEQIGKVDELLLHVSEYYESEVNYTIDNLITLIEPMLTVVLGGIILFIALGIFLPMWNLVSIIKH